MNEQTPRSSIESQHGGEQPVVAPWLRSNGVLLHIGPPKTATTAIQYGLSTARTELLAQGTLYPGAAPAQGAAVLALQQRHSSWQRVLRTDGLGDEAISRQPWNDLVAETRQWTGRVVISTEVLASCWPETVRRVVADLGGDRVQVLVTLRSVMDIAPSIWQQSVKAGLTAPFSEWLSTMLESEDGQFTFRRELLVSRWAEVVGAENLAVLFVSAKKPRESLRAVESLIGLPRDSLPVAPGKANRSMTAYEAEITRRTWELLDGTDVDKAEVLRLIQGGVAELVANRAAPATEPRMRLPQWSVPGLQAIDEETMATIEQLGVYLAGEPALTPASPVGDVDDESSSRTETQVADQAQAAAEVLGAFLATASRSSAKKRRKIERLRERNRKQRERFENL